MPFSWACGSRKANTSSRASGRSQGTSAGLAAWEREEIWRTSSIISSSSRRCLYALSDQDQRSYSGKDLSSLVETMLYPSEWDAVAQVEQYEGAAEDAPEKE